MILVELIAILSVCPLLIGLGIGCFGGGDCHCSTCAICADDFDRADSDDIDDGSLCGWTESSGDGDISGNNLITSSSSAKFRCQATHPSGGGAYAVLVSAKSSATNNKIIVWTDDTGNNYAQLEIGSAKTLKIFVGGVEKKSVNVTTAIDTTYDLTVVQSGDGILSAAVIGPSVNQCIAVTNASPAGTIYVAIGTGAATTGTVTFTTFTLEQAWSTSNRSCRKPCQPCLLCSADTDPPSEFEVEIEFLADAEDPATYWGAPDFIPECSTCDDLNAVYILKRKEPTFSSFGINCWQYYNKCVEYAHCESTFVCNDSDYGPIWRSITLNITLEVLLIDGTRQLVVRFGMNANPYNSEDTATDPDCWADAETWDMGIHQVVAETCTVSADRKYALTTSTSPSGSIVVACDEIPDEIVIEEGYNANPYLNTCQWYGANSSFIQGPCPGGAYANPLGGWYFPFRATIRKIA